MCRYGLTTYKPHYACFDCKKTFKRKLLWDISPDTKQTVEAKCPQCSQLMANMGLDFASPKKDNVKAWSHLKTLYSVGITFHSCGCSGPGYIPNSTEKLKEYFEDIKKNYFKNLDFWRQRTEPSNSAETDRDKSKNWEFICRMPDEIKTKKGVILNEDAKNYWFDKIKQVEQKIEKIK